MSLSHRLKKHHQESRHDCAALDIKFLDVNTFGDKALRSEIIGLFLAQLDSAKRSLVAPVDETAWQFLSHTLKGAAAAVGARQIAALADDWDACQAPSTAKERQEMADRLSALIADFKAASEQL
jgi:HPt (histidine-containing phosphotransfer) domain-containing protein